MIEKEEDVNSDKYALKEKLVFNALIFSDLRDKKISNQLNEVKQEYRKEIAAITERPEEEFVEDSVVHVIALDTTNNIIGFIAVGYEHNTKEVWEAHVYVKPECRRQGVHEQMLDRLKLYTRQIGYRRIVAGVYKTNQSSKRVHQKLGFEKMVDIMWLEDLGSEV